MAQATNLTDGVPQSPPFDRSDAAALLRALCTQHSGATRPAVLGAGGENEGLWVEKVSGTEWNLRYWDGNTDILLGTINPTTHEWVPASADGLFYKLDWTTVVLSKHGAGTISIKAGTKIELGGVVYSYAVDTAVQMPTLNAGTDYAIYQCNDGTLRADASFSAPAGFSSTTSRKIGGFHYAPGGNATGTSGGDSTPAINEYSIWDLKFRPSASDPRGMALIAGRFWCDIYLLGVNHHTDGTSKYGVTIADGSSPPKVPTAFGGNGSTTYGSLTWWEAAEVLAAYGKELLCYDEFAAAAYGVTEGTTVGADPGTTGLDAARTSKWGIMRAAGNMWVWGRDFSTRWDGVGGWGWRNNAAGRGQLYIGGDVNLVAALFGGGWGDGASAGSRASYWFVYPWLSNVNIGARGRCDHVCHV